ncbi:hypothetical protein QVH35_08900 [Candidatus Nitrosotenuis chungbukensis]|uniref:hypothetical protein n=1 Tax=Candidatus Nitrosotenuis chungbukensis TaxID=1353246 RepID=UPI0026714639|nr:hypothetical protein [Candidatus Nitrosotenuis chungbukensis]WKT57484.1 hypothetical protein QVH35_08900 [Candidatus Nitrosotenuis chungbukensis]
MTCDACAKYGIKAKGIVINNSDASGYAADDLASDLKNLSGLDVLCSIPHVDGCNTEKISRILAESSMLSAL